MATLPDLTAIVLAAGLSRRAAPHHKLLLPAPDGRGRVVVRATVEAFIGHGFDELIVVTGHESSSIEAALAGLPVRFVFAPDFAGGMGRSLAAGVRASPARTAGFVVSPGDLPGLTPALVSRVVQAFVEGGRRIHIVPCASGERGHPVVVGAWLREELSRLSGDEGARTLLGASGESQRCHFIELGHTAILRDVDTGRER